MQGCVIWITGLSGAGKTTLARELLRQVKQKSQMAVHLDGDDLRSVFTEEGLDKDNYDRAKRLELALKYSKICKLISDQGFMVIISTISMFQEVYAWNRKNIPNYFEAYLRVPLDELKKRDPKKLYEKFFNGEIINIAGLDLPVDEPAKPDVIIDFDKSNSPKFMATSLIEDIYDRGLCD